MDPFRISPVGVVETIVPSQGLTVVCHGWGYFAATHPRRTDISLWRLPQQHDDPQQSTSFNQMQWPLLQHPLLALSGNEFAVKALAFNKHRRFQSTMNDSKTNNNRIDTILLCSVDDHGFAVWDLSHMFLEKDPPKNDNDEAIRDTDNVFLLTSGKLVAENEIAKTEIVSYCCFSWDDRYIAVCRGSDIILIPLNTDGETSTNLLKGHDSCVNSAEFSPHRLTWLVSVSDDYTFIVWDVTAVSSGNVLQRSYIPNQTAVPLVVAMDFVREYVSIATADGHVLLVNLACAMPPTADDAKTVKPTPTQKLNFHIVRSLDCSKLVQKKVETFNASTLCSSVVNTVDSGCVVLSVSYFYSNQFSPYQKEASTEDLHFISQKSFFENLNQLLFLVIGTNKSILCLNAFTLECLAVIDLAQYGNALLGDFKTLSLMSMAQDLKTFDINCATTNHFDNAIHISKLSFLIEEKSLDKNTDKLFDLDHEKRFLCPNTKLSENSVLKLISTCKSLNKANPKTNSTTKPTSRINCDQPLTFQKNIKSSGYSAPPTNRTLFKPNIKSAKKGPKSKYLTRVSTIQYDPTQVIHCNREQKLSDNLTTAITHVTFSSDGKDLAVAFTDGTAMTVKPSLIQKPTLFAGHQRGLNSVNLSHRGRWLLTASNDKTASVWNADNAKSLLTFEKISRNFNNEHFSLKKKADCFEKEIKSAQFYYMDNFVLLASGRCFYLYSFNIDLTKDDVKRYLVKNEYKLVKHIEVEAKLIIDLAAINFFYSYIVLCCTSDRSLSAYDLNVGKKILTIEDTHPTPPHSIVLNAASGCLSLPASGYDLVLTAATTNGIKLWDLRSNQCVRRLDCHYNRSHQCRPAFSPCGKYVMAASENNTAYLYDIGEGVACQQLTRHSDIVTNVVYNPTMPQVITATLDGKLYSFNDKEI